MNYLCLRLALPNRVLSPNVRTHWSVKARSVKQHRFAGRVKAKQVMGRGFEPWESADVKITFYHKEVRTRDKDNLLAQMKAYMDGIADAGVVANDSRFTYLPIDTEINTTHPHVAVELFRTGGEQ